MHPLGYKFQSLFNEGVHVGEKWTEKLIEKCGKSIYKTELGKYHVSCSFHFYFCSLCAARQQNVRALLDTGFSAFCFILVAPNNTIKYPKFHISFQISFIPVYPTWAPLMFAARFNSIEPEFMNQMSDDTILFAVLSGSVALVILRRITLMLSEIFALRLDLIAQRERFFT